MGCASSREAKTPSTHVLLIGLDGAGSTTALYHLALGKPFETVPTLGFNHEVRFPGGGGSLSRKVGGWEGVGGGGLGRSAAYRSGVNRVGAQDGGRERGECVRGEGEVVKWRRGGVGV